MLYDETKLTDVFFKLLAAPDGKAIHGAQVLPPELLEQYYVGQHFPKDLRFRHTLLSPRGIESHDLLCTPLHPCNSPAKLRICHRKKDVKTLFSEKRTPKFAIAQGNWIGQLPDNMNQMTYGTCILRPIQSFGRLTSYFGSKFAGGRLRLTGHMYSRKLETPIVRSKIPLSPSDAPTRLPVLSPFASDQSAAASAKMASVRKEFIIQPAIIKDILLFWKSVGNKVMAHIELDEAALPKNDASRSNNQTNVEDKDCLNGGECLCLGRSKEDSENYVLTTSSLTIGAPRSDDLSGFEKLGNVLCPEISQPLTNSTSTAGVYVVRPAHSFASEKDPHFFEKHFPDKFCFGRGGPSEPRMSRISRNSLISHWLNLSTRQFQETDFLMPVYDLMTRELASATFIRSILPSRLRRPDGTPFPRGEIYGTQNPIF